MSWGGVTYSTYQPNKRQKIFHEVANWKGSNRVIKGAIGALGSGKSTGCMEEQALICMRTPDGASICGRKEKEKAKRSLRDEYNKRLLSVARWVASDSCWRFDNGHKLWLIPFEEWDSVGSFEIVSWYGQEMQEVEYRVFDALNDRIRAPEGTVEGASWHRGLFDARGVRKSHWIWKDFASQAWNPEDGPEARARAKNPDFVWVRFRTRDNTENLKAGYYEERQRDHVRDVGWQKMMLEGEFGFDIGGRPVYECYNPDIHDAQITPDPSLPILRGWDFGYNQPAVVFCQYTRSGRFLVLGELCPKGVSREELADMVESYQLERFGLFHPSQYRDFGDAAGDHANAATAITDIEFLENRFRTSVETRRARIQDGLEVIRNLMTKNTGRYDLIDGRRVAQPRFQVDVSCERLREALAGAYYYRDDKNDDKPIKGEGYDDVADALRYVAQLTVEEGIVEYGQSRFAEPDEGYGTMGASIGSF